MTTLAGTTGTIFAPALWASFDPTAALPKRNLPMGADFLSPWERLEFIGENINLDFANPFVEVPTKDHGPLMYIPGDGDGLSAQILLMAPKWKHLLLTTGMQESVSAATTQVSKITLSGTASAGGNILVNPGGITPVSIALASSDTAAQAATKIAAGTYTGYTPVASGAEVTFTATAAGAKGTPTVSGTPAGLTATFTTPTEGFDEVAAGILNPNYLPRLRLVIEGFAQEGGLFPEDRMVRLFGFNVTAAEVGGGGGGGRRGGGGGGGGGGRRGGGRGGGGGANPGSVSFGWKGDDANLEVALDIKFLPDANAAADLTTAGYPEAIQDRLGRFAWYNHKLAA